MPVQAAPRQKIMERIGAEGCYFLSLVRAAERMLERRIDAVDVYERAVSAGWLGADCYVINPGAIMAHMTGGQWGSRHEKAIYQPKAEEVTILRYELALTGKTLAHFVLADASGRSVEYDPYGDSRTVREGFLAGKRILWRVA